MTDTDIKMQTNIRRFAAHLLIACPLTGTKMGAHYALLDLASIAKQLIAPGERERSILTRTTIHEEPPTRILSREEATSGLRILHRSTSLATQITATLIGITHGVLSKIHIMLKLLMLHHSPLESGPTVDACL